MNPCLLPFTLLYKVMVGGRNAVPAHSSMSHGLSLMNNALASAVAMTYVVAMGAAPFLDYRGGGFFSVLGLGFAAPFVLLSILLCAAFFYAGMLAVSHFRRRNHLFALRLLCVSAALFAGNGLLIRYVIVSLLGPSPPRWFTHGAPYHVLALGASILVVAVLAGLLLGVPIAALVIGAMHLARKESSGLKYLMVVAGGLAAYAVALRTNDLLTLASCRPGIQAALEAVHRGRALPQPSRSFPFAVLDKTHDIVTCMLDGPLFDAQYVVYDSVDTSPADVAVRLARLLDRGRCDVSASRIKSSYFWLSGDC